VGRRSYDPRYVMLRKQLSTSVPSDTMFAISLVWDNQDECTQIVQALQSQYIEETGVGQQARSVATEKFLTEQIADYERRLQRAEQALTDFKAAHAGLTPEAETQLRDQISLLRGELDRQLISSQDGRLQRAALEARLAQIGPTVQEETIQSGDPSAAAGSDDPLAQQLRDLEQQKETLGKLYTPQSSQIAAVDTQIAALKEQIANLNRAQPARPAAPSRQVIARHQHENPEYQALMQKLTEAKITEATQKSQIEQGKQRITEKEAL